MKEEQVARLVPPSCGSEPMYPFEHVWDLVLALVKDRLILGASIGDQNQRGRAGLFSASRRR
jgi:hypothetical protein